MQFVVSSLECSAKNFAQVAKAFYHAQKAVLYPVAPLYNSNKRVRDLGIMLCFRVITWRLSIARYCNQGASRPSSARSDCTTETARVF